MKGHVQVWICSIRIRSVIVYRPVACLRNLSTNFARNIEGNRLLGRTRYRWEGNIKFNLREKYQGMGSHDMLL